MLGTASLVGAQFGCAQADLPPGWEDAEPVVGLVQQDCEGSGLDFDESATFLGGPGKLAVEYNEAHFRCEQKVEGYFRKNADAVDILVQPIDMNPSSYAACDCPYRITFDVEPLAPGAVKASLYRRWDDINEPNEPVLVDSAAVVVE